jgi:hypothetical protein
MSEVGVSEAEVVSPSKNEDIRTESRQNSIKRAVSAFLQRLHISKKEDHSKPKEERSDISVSQDSLSATGRARRRLLYTGAAVGISTALALSSDDSPSTQAAASTEESSSVLTGVSITPTENELTTAIHEQGRDVLAVIPSSIDTASIPAVSDSPPVPSSKAESTITPSGPQGEPAKPVQTPQVSKETQKSEPLPPAEQKGIVALDSFLDAEEIERSKEVKKLFDEFIDKFTFKTTIDGKNFRIPLPFAEVGVGYTFPVITFPDGSISSKMTPEAAQERFQNALSSGEFEKLYREKLEEYKHIDPNTLSPNDKLAYKNIGGKNGLSAEENYAYYNALRQLGIYGDCNGTTYNALSYVYDSFRGRGSFDKLVKSKFPDVNTTSPAIDFNMGRFGDSRWAETIDPPPTKALKAGDVIVIGKEQHAMLIVGWDEEKRALWVMQNTDESIAQGLDLFPIYIINPDMQLQYQNWGNARIAEDTTLPQFRGRERAQARLDEQIGGSGKPYKIMRNKEWPKVFAS